MLVWRVVTRGSSYVRLCVIFLVRRSPPRMVVVSLSLAVIRGLGYFRSKSIWRRQREWALKLSSSWTVEILDGGFLSLIGCFPENLGGKGSLLKFKILLSRKWAVFRVVKSQFYKIVVRVSLVDIFVKNFLLCGARTLTQHWWTPSKWVANYENTVSMVLQKGKWRYLE